MVTILDTYADVDLPGEELPENVIPFPGFEPDDPAPCAVCGLPASRLTVAVCSVCLPRFPRIGGCGLGLVVVAAFGHLLACDECGDWFDSLGHAAGAAAQEKTYAGSVAAAA